jgi:hypothetical protein
MDIGKKYKKIDGLDEMRNITEKYKIIDYSRLKKKNMWPSMDDELDSLCDKRGVPDAPPPPAAPKAPKDLDF